MKKFYIGLLLISFGFFFLISDKQNIHAKSGIEVINPNLTAKLMGQRVVLFWTVDKNDVKEFEIYRSTKKEGKYTKVSDLSLPYEIVNSNHTVAWRDKETEPGRSYFYRLAYVHPEGSRFCKETVEVSIPIIPDECLLRAEPLEGNDTETEIVFSLQRAGEVKIKILDDKGKAIRQLLDTYQLVGVHSVFWDGKDELNRSMPAGTYRCEIVANKFEKVCDIVLQ